MNTAFVIFSDFSLSQYSQGIFLEFESKTACLFKQFLLVLFLELNVCLVGGAFVIAEEPPQIDLVEGISVGVVGGAGEGGVEGAIGADKIEVHTV